MDDDGQTEAGGDAGTLADPPTRELPTAIDRPRPLPRAVAEPAQRSQAGTTVHSPGAITTAADAMRDEEIHRTRVFIRIGWAASLGGMAALPVLDGVPVVTAAYAAALVLGMLVSFGYHQAFRDP
ncbi:MAG TPA: hypothetical protein VFQ65_22920, partial [Kofleriaceae bacterium]|nr:hypothetical protein [Kofleriaceae bacterium]